METLERGPAPSIPEHEPPARRNGTKPRLATILEAPSKEALVTGSIVSVLLLGVADITTGKEVSWFPFYLLPVSLMAWSVGLWPALGMSAFSSAVWLSADLFTAGSYSEGWIYYWNAGVRLGLFVVVVVLLSSLRRGHDIEHSLARTDPVTGLANARYFHERAAAEMERSRRFGHPLSVAYVDLDDFKDVNEERGHIGGDAVLRQMGEYLCKSVRAYDVVARLGGDEFAVLMPETDAESARIVAGALPRRIHEAAGVEGLPTTLSIGVATFDRPPGTVDEMVRHADQLMYQVKAGGKDGVLHAAAG